MNTFSPPISLGGYRPTPGTLSEFIYQVWLYLSDNPIPDDSDVSEAVKEYVEENPEFANTIAEIVDEYIAENPPDVPVESVQGMTGAVVLAYNNIVPNTSQIPVHVNASNPTQASLVSLYNQGYRFFYNSTTALLYVINNLGEISSVGSPVSVTSVNGSTGAVVLDGNDLLVSNTEGSSWGDFTLSEVLNNLFHVGFTIVTKAAPAVWNPNNYFPGTWTLIENAFIYGAASTDTLPETDVIQGEASHKLLASELPIINGSITIRGYVTSGGNAGNVLTGASGVFSQAAGDSAGSFKSADSSPNVAMRTANLSIGGDQTHNNMPPYLKRFIWERTE